MRPAVCEAAQWLSVARGQGGQFRSPAATIRLPSGRTARPAVPATAHRRFPLGSLCFSGREPRRRCPLHRTRSPSPHKRCCRRRSGPARMAFGGRNCDRRDRARCPLETQSECSLPSPVSASTYLHSRGVDVGSRCGGRVLPAGGGSSIAGLIVPRPRRAVQPPIWPAWRGPRRASRKSSDTL